MEDAVETNNVVANNLGVLTRASNALLATDQTPGFTAPSMCQCPFITNNSKRHAAREANRVWCLQQYSGLPTQTTSSGTTMQLAAQAMVILPKLAAELPILSLTSLQPPRAETRIKASTSLSSYRLG